MSDRTHPPSPRHLAQAASEGDVLASSLLVKAVSTLCVLLVIPSSLGLLISWARASLRATLAIARDASNPAGTGSAASQDAVGFSLVSSPDLSSLWSEPLRTALECVAPPLLAGWLAALLVPIALAGKVPWAQGRRAPSRGFRTLLLALASTAMIAALAMPAVHAVLASSSLDPASLVAVSLRVAYRLAAGAVVTLVAVGAVDVALGWRARMVRLQMSTDEVRREEREVYGSAETRQAREAARRA